MASSTCGVIRRRQCRHGAASVANSLYAGNPYTGARRVWRTASATSVEMAIILFGITLAPQGLAKIPAHQSFVPVHLGLIVCVDLSDFRVQIETPTLNK